jgi:hypothetical protein
LFYGNSKTEINSRSHEMSVARKDTQLVQNLGMEIIGARERQSPPGATPKSGGSMLKGEGKKGH